MVFLNNNQRLPMKKALSLLGKEFEGESKMERMKGQFENIRHCLK